MTNKKNHDQGNDTKIKEKVNAIQRKEYYLTLMLLVMTSHRNSSKHRYPVFVIACISVILDLIIHSDNVFEPNCLNIE